MIFGVACVGANAASTHPSNDGHAGWRDSSLRDHAVNPADLSDITATRRRATLAALFGLAAVGGPAMAQMGGGGGHRHAQQPDTTPAKDAKDTGDAAPPRDLVSALAMRLHEGVPDLALTPKQQNAWRDFVGSLTEVGEHNERRLQRIFSHSAGAVSAASPLKTYIAAEVDEGEDRQEALSELKVNFDKLDSLIDERQRGIVTNLFLATRTELQAGR